MRVVVRVSVAGLLFSALSIDAMHRVKKIVGQMQENPSEAVKADRGITKDIFHAAILGDLKAVKYWLDQGADKNAKNSDGWTVLTIAAQFGYLDIIKYLIEQGADKEAMDNTGGTLLGRAIGLGNLDIVKYLFEQETGKEAKDYFGRKVLILAAQFGKLNIVKYLIEQGVDKETKDNNGLTVLTWAVQLRKLDIVRYLIEQGAGKEAKDNNGETLLAWAAGRGYLDIVKYLVEQGADKEAKDLSGSTVLMKAVQRGRLDIVKYLIEKRADKEAKDNNGDTALIGAVGEGSLDIVKYLIEQGADKEAKNSVGWTVLMRAAQRGRLDIVKYLIEQGADKEAKDNNGNTALMWAFSSARFDVMKWLIQHGATFDTIRGELLDSVANSQDDELYQLLVAKGFDIHKLNAQGETLLMGALIKQANATVEFLIKHGVNPSQEDEAGLNAFDYAQDNPELLALLNKTTHTHTAPARKAIVAESESDTKKAIRRLQHIKRAMHPELPKTHREEKISEEAPAFAGLTQTEAHWNQFGTEIENKYGKVLDDPLVKKVLARERKAIAQGKYVFYRSEPGKYRVYEYFMEELYRLVNLYSQKSEFVWNRFFKDAAKEQTINEYIDTMRAQAHREGAEFNVLLSANIALFGNVNNIGSCTWDYFLKNYEATGRVELLQTFKRIFDRYGFDEKYIDQLLALHQGVLEKTATLQQIIVPKDIVDDVVMFSTHGYCFPWQEQVDKGQPDSCWDPNAISVDLGSNPKKGRYTCISSLIDKYRDGRIAIDDAYQVRILMNAVYGLNPESGIEIYQYTRLPEKKLLHFKKQVQKITDEMFGEWLKEQLGKKEVSESIKDEKLGGVLQHLGKGRKEPVKSKL